MFKSSWESLQYSINTFFLGFAFLFKVSVLFATLILVSVSTFLILLQASPIFLNPELLLHRFLISSLGCIALFLGAGVGLLIFKLGTVIDEYEIVEEDEL